MDNNMKFTYKLPDENDFREEILAKLESFPSEGNELAYSFLSVSSLELEKLNSRSDTDRHIKEIAIVLRVPISDFKDYEDEITDIENTITNTANDVLLRDCGFKAKYTDANPLVGKNNKDARTIIKQSLDTMEFITLGEELIEKGKKMANAYIIVYCLENFLRDFIDRKLTDFYGSDYESKNVFSKKTRNRANDRKKEESANRWLAIRGDKILYYLDFAELPDVITLEDNWNNIFKNYFPSQDWIKSKLDELYQIRNRIAHNSYLDDNSFKTLELYYHQIISQIG